MEGHSRRAKQRRAGNTRRRRITSIFLVVVMLAAGFVVTETRFRPLRKSDAIAPL